jgi:uncharacterized protein YkwD
MIFLQIHIPQASTSQIKVLSMTAATLLLLSFVLCQSASAQSMQPRPVARLITGTVSNASYSRPRRVLTEARSFPSAVTTTAGGATSLSLPNATSIERRAFEQTNRARAQSGLAPLAWDSELCRMARLHSQKMGEQRFFSHESPDGMQLKERARANGILHFRVIAENIAYNKGYADPGAFAVERWMISAGHRANILYTGFQASAIGSYVSADGSVYLTQVFIAR